MGILHVNHIQKKLRETYTGKIDISDARNDNERENFFLTRAFAAYSLQCLGNIEPINATESIVDGFNDNGIDLILFDKKKKILWIIQSKWIKNGTSQPDNGEVLKFCEGIKDIIELKFENFNEKVKLKENEVIEALEDPYVKIKIVLAYTGNDFLSIHNKRALDDLLEALNDPSELAYLEIFNLGIAHKSLIGILGGQPINTDLILTNWGKTEEPYQSFYGIISGGDLANLWSENRFKLLSENIRDFIGFTEVNEEIFNTIQTEPKNFFYYNNGLTALCRKITKKPVGGGDRNTGIFYIEDFKIVNGAQTVGTLGNVLENNKHNLDDVKVFIKIISLENCPDGFGVSVTRCTNTQNKIERRDFVSLDPENERIKTELSLEGINYHYIRSDEQITPDDKNFYVDEIITALACEYSEVDYTVIAKREIGKLWENIEKKPYIDLINSKLSAIKIIRCIAIFREINKILKEKELRSTGRLKSHYIHSNRFVLHMVFQIINKEIINDPLYDFNSFKTKFLPNIAVEIIEKTHNIVEEIYQSSLIHQLYRNLKKCKEIKKKFVQ
ncbi:MAG: AIPR family protein [Brevinematales bacterium]|nr:AIPR family protein [Brevinematales bacterium]